MTNPFITLNRVSYRLPNGRLLFSELSDQFDLGHTGLVGRNGVGKTVLARILAGQLAPSSGQCIRSGDVYYLPQQFDFSLPFGRSLQGELSHQSPSQKASSQITSSHKSASQQATSVAQLMGIAPILSALNRIEEGSTHPLDFDVVGDCWDIRQRAQRVLSGYGLEGLELTRPVDRLSGGQAMRVALAGAMLSEADFLILDEPTNHLDQSARHSLIAGLEQWSRGLIVISHDRQLLDHMTSIVELSSLGLQRYGGPYAVYAAKQAQAQQRATQQLAQQQHEQERLKRRLRLQQARQERRLARGERHRKGANQAKILLDGQKARSEVTTGKRQQQQQKMLSEQSTDIQQAALAVKQEAQIHLHHRGLFQQRRSHQDGASVISRYVAVLEDVELPFVASPTKKLNLQVHAGQRVAVTGPNGCGKSTFLKVLAGQLQPRSGYCRLLDRAQVLDQSLTGIDPERSALSLLHQANPKLSDSEARMLLAQLDLGARKVIQPSHCLSGGERLKAALACVLYAEQAAEMLLLDEPSNHLDLPSLAALESLLRDYQGTLFIVSHDLVFLQRLNLTGQLNLTASGYHWAPWTSF